jgi:hypothetical protein
MKSDEVIHPLSLQYQFQNKNIHETQINSHMAGKRDGRQREAHHYQRGA